jgi:hypothetical protein
MRVASGFNSLATSQIPKANRDPVPPFVFSLFHSLSSQNPRSRTRSSLCRSVVFWVGSVNPGAYKRAPNNDMLPTLPPSDGFDATFLLRVKFHRLFVFLA